MGRKAQIAIVTTVLALIFGAVGAFALDSVYRDEIAEGVTIGGIDVSGADEAEAREEVNRRILEPLSRPVKVTYKKKLYKLSTKKLGLRADTDRMVDEAFEASHQGGLPGRVWRGLTGGEVDRAVPLRVAYSKRSVSKFIETIVSDLSRDPVDATVEPSASSLDPVPHKAGMEVNAKHLRDRIDAALADSTSERRIAAKVSRIEPETTIEELAAQYPHYIVVDRASFKLRYYQNLKLVKKYTVGIGQVGYDTPAGLYHIQNKAVDPTWNVPDSDWAGELAGRTIPPGPQNPLKARWMGIYNGAGIHGTDDVGSLGSAASHGCIRMSVLDVKELYDLVPTGAPIYIA